MKQVSKSFSIIFFFLLFVFWVNAQDTLPNFTVRQLAKGKVQVSWINPFNKMVQLIVQRSFDSTKYFRSIFSSQSPWLPQNGFVDNNAPQDYKVFYRIQYVFEGGEYFFTSSKAADKFDNIRVESINDDPAANEGNKNAKKIIKVYRNTKDTLVAEVDYKNYKRFRDSVYRNTKDTLRNTEYDDEVIIKPYIPKPVWKASAFVFTNEKGYIRIVLPNFSKHKYKLVFFNEQGDEVLLIRHIKEDDLVLDKSNFRQNGWYYFELYQDDKVFDKNKIYIINDRRF